MGQITDFVGHIDVTPRLNETEIEHIGAFPRMTPVLGQPDSSCCWVSSPDGRCLTLGSGDDYGDATAWLRLIVRQFRVRRGAPRFNGMVVGSRRGTEELFAIQVRSNRVNERVLWPRQAHPREARRQPGPSRTPTANVIDLAARRAQG